MAWILLNWLIPFVGCFAYALLLRVTGDVKFVKWERVGIIPVARWQLISKKSWYAKLWSDWYGVGLFMNIIHRDEDGIEDDSFVKETVTHELRHSAQWAVLGLLQPVLYVSEFVRILFLQELQGKPYTKHPYLDNWFERDARRYAKQVVDIEPGSWPHGPLDLNPWFKNPTAQEVYDLRREWWAQKKEAA